MKRVFQVTFSVYMVFENYELVWLKSFRFRFYVIKLPGNHLMLSMCLAARNDVRHFLLSLFWAGLSLGVAAFVRANGRTFTNRPRLFRSRH